MLTVVSIRLGLSFIVMLTVVGIREGPGLSFILMLTVVGIREGPLEMLTVVGNSCE